MKNFKVLIFKGQDETFTTSYQHPLNKRRVRMSFLNQVSAEEYKKTVEQKFKKTRFTYYRGASVEQLLLYFMQEVPNGYFHQEQTYLVDFIETFGEHTLDEITPRALKLWMDQVQAEGKIKNVTMKGLKCKIDSFFNFLVEKEIIAQSPLSCIYYEVKDVAIKSRNILYPDEIDTLLKSLKDYSPGLLYPIVRMFSETAAKSSEIVELTWKQLDLKRGIVTFNQKNKVGERELNLSNELVSLLKSQQRREGRVFITPYKEDFTYDKLRSFLNEFKRKKLYKKDWSPADLRHSFAVNFLEGGGGLKELQRILGHWSVYETKKLYGDVLNKEKNSSEEINNPFKKQG